MFQSMTYAYSGDRVTSMTRGAEEDNMLWDYRYDRRGQVSSADKKFSNGEFAAGLQTEYAYDMAGNRTSKAQGGSATTTEGTGVRSTTYGTANALNQYPSVTNPYSPGSTPPSTITRWADVSGRRSSSSEAIQVNGVTAGYQQDTTTGKHFRREVPLTATDTYNTNYAYLYTTSTSGGSTTYLDAGYSYLPPPEETLTYDADGNLLSDGRWIYTWDAENRLAGLVSVEADIYSGYPDSPWFRWTFKYDGLSRRILTTKEYFSVDTWDFVMASQKTMVYDAWNLIHQQVSDYYLDYSEENGWFLTLASFAADHYVWGPDIGSPTHGHTSWQKAGGVGGLLYLESGGYPEFPLMDRLGNVTGSRRAVSGSAAALDAVYEYDAFGREVRSTGPASDMMPFRFSTKYTDAETGLVYYGYRFYDPDRGRWLNRDPIGELGGFNLYIALANNIVNAIDILGNIKFDDFVESSCGDQLDVAEKHFRNQIEKAKAKLADPSTSAKMRQVYQKSIKEMERRLPAIASRRAALSAAAARAAGRRCCGILAILEFCLSCPGDSRRPDPPLITSFDDDPSPMPWGDSGWAGSANGKGGIFPGSPIGPAPIY